MHSDWYQPLFEKAKALFGKQIWAYYYDLTFEETMRRHATKPNKKDFGEKEMRAWWSEKDFMNAIPEKRITAEISLEEAVAMVSADVGQTDC